MKRFTMHPFSVKVETDNEGNLYDPVARELVAQAHGDRDRLEAIAALRVASLVLHEQMRRNLGSEQLSEGRLHLLMLLRMRGEHAMTPGELAKRMRVTPRNVTGLLDALERDMLVSRIPDPNDRRSLHVTLTPEGVRRISGIISPVLAQEVELTDCLSQDEVVVLRQLCLRIVQASQGGAT